MQPGWRGGQMAVPGASLQTGGEAARERAFGSLGRERAPLLAASAPQPGYHLVGTAKIACPCPPRPCPSVASCPSRRVGASPPLSHSPSVGLGFLATLGLVVSGQGRQRRPPAPSSLPESLEWDGPWFCPRDLDAPLRVVVSSALRRSGMLGVCPSPSHCVARSCL